MNKKSEASFTVERIKQLTIAGLFSDDLLAETLVLKGGNALSLIYKLGHRGSLDLDFSIDGEFSSLLMENIEVKITNALNKAFEPEKFIVFDVVVEDRPPQVTADLKSFWGGYKIEFKIISSELYIQEKGSLENLRRHALVTGPEQAKKVKIEISKHEFCKNKEIHEVDGIKVAVYSPVMILCEKLRAICQHTEEYDQIVKRASRDSGRARDFFDIYTVMNKYPIDPTSRETQSLLKDIFNAKHVPLKLLGKMEEYRDLHTSDFDSVRNTVPPGANLKNFDFYFDFTLKLCEAFKSLWEINPPLL
jgi:predicted nucleotidyltransferase component of viral defense system